MKSRVLNSFEEAVADIPDGAAIMVGGFGPGTPRNLIRALARRRARDLTIICNAPGDGTDRTDVRKLVQNGCVRKVICSFITADDPLIERSAPKGDTIVEMVPQGTLAERIRAGGAGIPAFYTPTGIGTEIAAGKESRKFGERACLLEYGLTADYALIRAWKADALGNLAYRLSQRNFNPLMATAAACVIAEVEEPFAAPGDMDPDSIHTPALFVDRVVRIPPPPEGIWEKPWPSWE